VLDSLRLLHRWRVELPELLKALHRWGLFELRHGDLHFVKGVVLRDRRFLWALIGN
jgi:hypothetical protein